MTTPSTAYSRKLAAIMFSDIKAFSQKMSTDEESAMMLLKAYDGLMRVLSTRFGGRVLKCVGDLFMIDFRSSVNAVRCAIEAQQRFWSYNQDKPELSRIEIRIGIHMGDVLIQDDNIIGDSVNVASLIESLAEPNRILISHDIYNQVKNKVPVNVFELGALSLKDVKEPVKLFEILIDDIPELAKPSNSALLVKNQHSFDQAIQNEAEEKKEAANVEQTRQRVLLKEAQHQESRKREIEDLYTKAEESVQKGNLDEAEQTLNQALKLGTGSSEQAPVQIDPKETEAQAYYAKAKELLDKGALDDAEKEVNNIFHIRPLHVGAQQLMLQIEEQRHRKAKAEKKPAEEKSLTENEIKIAQLLDKVRGHIAAEEFQEAIFTLRELYVIDPNHQEARIVEVELHDAEHARAERLQIEAEQAEEKKRQQRLEHLRRQLEEKKKRHQHVQKEYQKTQYTKRIIQISVLLIGLALLTMIVSKTIDYFFPKTASIAIMPFTSDNIGSDGIYLLKAIPRLIADDMGQCEHITVAAPSSSLNNEATVLNYKALASVLQVRYIVTGSIKKLRDSYVITYEMIDEEDQTVVFSMKQETKLSSLKNARVFFLEAMIKNLDIHSGIPVIPQLTPDQDALTLYLHGLSFINPFDEHAILHAIAFYESAIRIDTNFSLAYAHVAASYYRLYELTHNVECMAIANTYARRLLKSTNEDPFVQAVTAQYFRYTSDIGDARLSLDEVFHTSPPMAFARQENTWLLLRQGKDEEAYQQAKMLEILDPLNPTTYWTLGFAAQWKHADTEAVRYYRNAIRLGYPDSLLTADLLSIAWLNTGQLGKVVRTYKNILEQTPQDYRIYYKIGQAYQWMTQIDTAQQWLSDGMLIIKDILDKDPTNARAHVYSGMFFSRLGEFSNAETEMKKGLAADSENVEFLYRAADMYSLQKNKAMAFAMLKKALAREYRYYELLNVDLAYVALDPDFKTAATYSTETR